MKKAQTQQESNVTEIEASIIQICREFFPEETLDVNVNFMEIGADSIILNNIAEKIEKIYPNRISVIDMFSHPTIKELASFLTKENNLCLPSFYPMDAYFVSHQQPNPPKMYNITMELDDEKTDGVVAYFMERVISSLAKLTDKTSFSLHSITNKKNFLTIVYKAIDKQYEQNILQIDDLEKVKITKDKASISIIIVDRAMYSSNISLSKFYDVVFECDLKNPQLHIYCSYNENLLTEDFIEELINAI